MQPEIKKVWEETLAQIKGVLNGPTFNSCFRNIEPVEMKDGVFIISTANDFTRDWIERKHIKLIRDSVSRVVGREMEISLIIRPKQAVTEKAAMEVGGVAAPPQAASRPKDPSLHPKYTFESFVMGSSNRFAYEASLAVAESPASSYNPLFIYGGVGLGKTHLLQAIGHYVRTHHPSLKFRYVTSEKFTNDFIESIRAERISGFNIRYRQNDVLLVDDIQFLEGKEGIQEAFFHTFNALYEANKQIVISSDRPPRAIATLEDRLSSRFEMGLITDIQPPDIETRTAILQSKADSQGLSLPNEVLSYVASKITSNIRELEGALIRIVAFSSLTKTPIDIKFTEDVLRDIFPDTGAGKITIEKIQKEVSHYFGVDLDELLGKKRVKEIVYARQLAMYLSRELANLSLPVIGDKFGGRDHTTVLHAKNKIERLMSEQRPTYNQIQELTNRLKRS